MYEIQVHTHTLRLETAPGLFSPAHADAGTLALLSRVTFGPTDHVLDLGCGCGIVGLTAACDGAASVLFTDRDPDAVAVSLQNARTNLDDSLFARVSFLESDAYTQLPAEVRFTQIVSNPPYHTDFSVAKRFIEGAFPRLCVGGKLWMVTKRLDWYKNKLTAVFGGVRVTEQDGYYIFVSEKRAESRPDRKSKKKQPASGLSKKLERKLRRS